MNHDPKHFQKLYLIPKYTGGQPKNLICSVLKSQNITCMKQQVATSCKCKIGQEKKSSYRNHIAILSKKTQHAELQVSISWAGILLANKQLTCTKELGLMYYYLGVQISYCYISWSHWECNPQRHSSASMDEFLMEEPAFASENNREYWITVSSILSASTPRE